MGIRRTDVPPDTWAALMSAVPRSAQSGGVQAVTIPAPPSANNLFATAGRRRVKSQQYRQWLYLVVPALGTLAAPELPTRYLLTLSGKWNMQSDGENALKAVLDAVVLAGVLPDDSLKHVVGGRWVYVGGEGQRLVTVGWE